MKQVKKILLYLSCLLICVILPYLFIKLELNSNSKLRDGEVIFYFILYYIFNFFVSFILIKKIKKWKFLWCIFVIFFSDIIYLVFVLLINKLGYTSEIYYLCNQNLAYLFLFISILREFFFIISLEFFLKFSPQLFQLLSWSVAHRTPRED